MKALDLFCCAGGASSGLHQAGFDVTGIDIEQHSYPWAFIQGDALALRPDVLARFDFVWASPPCQFATAYKRRKAHVKPATNLIPATRALLEAAGVPYVIENVAGARHELRDPTMFCGSSFKLDIRRHRYFEARGFKLTAPPCDHSWQTPRFAQATNRKNKRSTVEIGVWRIPMDVQYKAMGGCWWMTRKELSQAIPPAYAKHIAEAFLSQRQQERPNELRPMRQAAEGR